MLEIRPIVINDDNVVLGGNMRLEACKKAGLKEVPVIKASDLSADEQRQFIIKDNVGFGDWDWDLLANEWNNEDLEEWGLDVWQPEEESEAPPVPPDEPLILKVECLTERDRDTLSKELKEKGYNVK